MADTKISDLTAITGANTAADDDFVIVDTSAAQTKRITRDELRVSILDGPHSSSAGSVALGTDALEDSSAAYATAVGVYALKENTTGDRNTAVGLQALRDNTTSDSSTAVGYNALALSNGAKNQAFGALSLDANTTGIYNSAYGYASLTANVSGNYNVVVSGRNGLGQCVSGIGNVAVGGYGVLSSLDDGDYNTAVGHFAGNDLEGGSNNVLIGRNAGQDIVDADSNVCVGYVAGNDISSGQVNTCVGFNAGNTLTTGSNNTLLGRDATPSAATVSNEITLGSSSATALRVPGVDFYIDDGDVTVGGGSIQLKGNTYTDFSDYWGSGDNQAIFTPYGYLGSNGGFAVSLFSNGYRNNSGGFTSMGINGQSTASGIELNPTGVIQFRTGTPSGTSVPERMRIDSSGKVGIGASSPNAKLTVSESTNDTASATFYNTAGGSGGTQGKGHIGLGIVEGWAFPGAEIGWDQESNSGYQQALTFSTRANSNVRPTERMRIDSTGKLGIGTVSPSNLVDAIGSSGSISAMRVSNTVVGLKLSAYTNSHAEIRVESNHALTFKTNGNNERMRIDSSGNVGIGTSSPAAALDLVGRLLVDCGAGSSVPAQLSSGASSSTISFVDTGTTANQVRIGSNSGSLMAITGGAIRMTINSSGSVTIGGSLSKGSGSFKIDHPLKPDTHHLVHSFVEGPQADNLYRGKAQLVGGQATVNLDDAGRMSEGTFVALNGNVQCFTTNESGWTQVRGTISGNALTIEAQDATCTDTVSWLVIGERHDQHMLDTEWTDENGRVITEPEKETTLEG